MTRPSGTPLPRSRRPFRDNPRLILASILLLAVALFATLFFADRSSRLSPDFLTEFVLYALSVADLTLLVALGFVLARYIIKLLVERRRALPFARFRAKIVTLLLGMTLIPAVLVLFVGSELIRNSVERWFNAPMDDILSSAKEIAGDYYGERQRMVNDEAVRIARALAPLDLANFDLTAIRRVVDPEVAQQRVAMVEVYRVESSEMQRPSVTLVVGAEAPGLGLGPSGYDRASADRLAERAAAGTVEPHAPEPIGTTGELIRGVAPIRGADSRVTGVVVASDHLAGGMAARSRRMTDAYEEYAQLRVLKRPLTGVYLSFFVMVTLMILVSSAWMGLYLAKRITRPVQALAAAAREIGAGHLDHRVERETADEFGSLVDAFNAMASELAVSQRKLEQSAVDLERKHAEVEARRRYIETILERIATGVVSVDAEDHVTTVNSAAARLLGINGTVAGEPAKQVFSRLDLEPLWTVLRNAGRSAVDPAAHEIALVRGDRELHLAAAATKLHGEGGQQEGTVLVFEDITPLIRAQKVAAWREVARRLAHEIKNPLTPIQLCAERLRRHFSGSPPATKGLVDECTETIVGEVESLKALVDEFSQFARMPAPKRVLTDLHQVLGEALALYNGLFQDVRITAEFAAGLPPVRVDPEQIRRVIINLVDNAIEAMERRGTVGVGTSHDAPNQVVRITVADNGPGIPPSERDKLFMPYYSTKRRGSGLGLAIVRRIVAEHGGSIEVGDEVPHGTRFTIELPCA
jgi:two-component system nitrogen regulation sensor histidine kinase NtrY